MDPCSIHRTESEEKSCKRVTEPSAEEMRLRSGGESKLKMISGGESAIKTDITELALTTMTVVPIIATDSVESPDGKTIPAPHPGKSGTAAIVVEGRDGRRGGGNGISGFLVGSGSKSTWTSDSKIAETSIAVIVQSTAIVIPLHFSIGLSSSTRDLLVCVLGANLVGFLFCMAVIIQSHERTRAAGIFARIGCAATVMGFILIIALILPDNHVSKIAPTCLVLFAAIVLSFL